MASNNKPNERYDRQLRLWGEHGQDRLISAHVCLLGASAAGSEALKNLVLPGVGSFTIVSRDAVDPSMPTFFFDRGTSDGGGVADEPASAVMSRLLTELNPSVRGSFIAERPVDYVRSDPDFPGSYTLVLLCDPSVGRSAAREIARRCEAAGVPIIRCREAGLIGDVSSWAPPHPVRESRPDFAHDDLRVLHPFPALAEHCSRIFAASVPAEGAEGAGGPETADGAVAFTHVPWVVILTMAVEEFRSRNSGASPSTFKEKKAVAAIVQEWCEKRDPSRGAVVAENFAEASRAAVTALLPAVPKDEVARVLAHPLARREQLRSGSADFWFVASALADFVAADPRGEGPVTGRVPDMTATTRGFVDLQRVYATRFEADVDNVHARVAALLAGAERKPEDISRETVAGFVREFHNLRVREFVSLSERLGPLVSRDSAADTNTSPSASDTADRDAGSDGRAAQDAASPTLGNEYPITSADSASLTPAAEGAQQQQSGVSSSAAGGASGRNDTEFKGEHGADHPPKHLDAAMRSSFADEIASGNDDAVFRICLDALDAIADADDGIANIGTESASAAIQAVLRWLQNKIPADAVEDAFVEETVRMAGKSVHSTSAVLGGIAAQEAVKILTHQFVPETGTVVFNGLRGAVSSFQF